jgi:hypothetical protein
VIKPVKKYIEAAKEEATIIEKVNELDRFGRYAPMMVEEVNWKGYYIIVTSLHGNSLYSLMRRNKHIGMVFISLSKGSQCRL